MDPDEIAQLPYSEPSFWTKLAEVATQAGYEVIEKALWLFYAARKPDVPARAKAIIYGTLGYFILPFDAIPDTVPLLGFNDDLLLLAAAVAVVACHIDAEVKAQARAKLQDWFGPAALTP